MPTRLTNRLCFAAMLLFAGTTAAQQPAPTANEAIFNSTTASPQLEIGQTANRIQPVTLLEESAIAGAKPVGEATGEVEEKQSAAPSLGALTQPGNFGSTLQISLAVGALSMAPAILLMTTSFVRIAVVLGILRQAIGAQQLPPAQVITALAIFMSILIMTPVWTKVYNEAIAPCNAGEISAETAFQTGSRPVRDFMARQIQAAENGDDIWLFYRYAQLEGDPPAYYHEVPLQVLLPAYLISELKVAFLIGFQIFLPFLVLDIVVASVTVSLGMNMLPPATIAIPLKIMLFVLADGWRLIAGMLLESFAW